MRGAGLWLTLASLFFYGWWKPEYLVIIVLSVVANYWLGVAIHLAQHGKIRFSPKFMLGVGVTLNLIALGYYKYANFFVDSVNSVWALHWNVPGIFLPLAISFFTFTQIAYLVDAYHGVTEDYDFLYYALFVTFFPHLIAGPIVSYRRLMPQFAQAETYRFDAGNFAAGLSMFTFGLAKKVIIADNLAALPQMTFDHSTGLATPDLIFAWLGTLAYTLQLYFDFSGYSDMAIGIAKMFNVRFPLNFNSPYKAADISDFWRRWHMTLSQFLRDHIYIPLGGNRCSEPRRYFNLIITMLLGGLWHGAGWNFVIWGGLHGLYLMIHQVWTKAVADVPWAHGRPMVFAGRVVTLLAVVVGWVFFRSSGLPQAFSVLGAMFHPESVEALKSDLLTIMSSSSSHILIPAIFVMVLGFVIVFFAPNTDEIFRLTERYTSRDKTSIVPPALWNFSWRWALSTGSLLTLAILYLFEPERVSLLPVLIMAATPRHYLLICIGFALAALGTVGAINYVVDPYGLYHNGKSWDWPHHRAGIGHFLYGFKARAVEDAQADVVILGSSRAPLRPRSESRRPARGHL